MNTTQLNTIPSPPEGQDLATVPMKFEVTPIPVTDFDRAKAFYQRLGWQLDIDLQFTEQVRGVQFPRPAPRRRSSSDRRARAPPAPAADRRGHRGRPHRARRTRHRGQRDLPRPPRRSAPAGARPGRPLLRQPRHLLGPRRQPVGPAGSHRADPRPGVTGVHGSPARDVHGRLEQHRLGALRALLEKSGAAQATSVRPSSPPSPQAKTPRPSGIAISSTILPPAPRGTARRRVRWPPTCGLRRRAHSRRGEVMAPSIDSVSPASGAGWTWATRADRSARRRTGS